MKEPPGLVVGRARPGLPAERPAPHLTGVDGAALVEELVLGDVPAGVGDEGVEPAGHRAAVEAQPGPRPRGEEVAGRNVLQSAASPHRGGRTSWPSRPSRPTPPSARRAGSRCGHRPCSSFPPDGPGAAPACHRARRTPARRALSVPSTSDADGFPALTHTATSPAASPSDCTGVVSAAGVAETVELLSPSARPVGPKAPAAKAPTTTNSAPLCFMTRRSLLPAPPSAARTGLRLLSSLRCGSRRPCRGDTPHPPGGPVRIDDGACVATDARQSRKPSGVSSERTRIVHCDRSTTSRSPPGTSPTSRMLRGGGGPSEGTDRRTPGCPDRRGRRQGRRRRRASVSARIRRSPPQRRSGGPAARRPGPCGRSGSGHPARCESRRPYDDGTIKREPLPEVAGQLSGSDAAGPSTP